MLDERTSRRASVSRKKRVYQRRRMPRRNGHGVSSLGGRRALADHPLVRVSSLAPSADARPPRLPSHAPPANTTGLRLVLGVGRRSAANTDGEAVRREADMCNDNGYGVRGKYSVGVARFANVYRWQKRHTPPSQRIGRAPVSSARADPPLASCRQRATQLTQNGRPTLTAEAESRAVLCENAMRSAAEIVPATDAGAADSPRRISAEIRRISRGAPRRMVSPGEGV